MRKNRTINLIVAAVIVAATVIIDQITKLIATEVLGSGRQIVCIPAVLRWSYVENKGAAFGSLADARWVFLIASSVLIIAIIVYMFRSKNISRLQNISLAFVLGGGIGNMIDRVAHGYVVDFVDFYFISIWKWVFNFADACVCVGGIVFALSLLFEKKKEDNGTNG